MLAKAVLRQLNQRLSIKRQIHYMKFFIRALVLLFAAFPFLCAQEKPIESGQRELALDMLKDVHATLKSDYYDEKFHGVDIEARFGEATAVIEKATSFNQALGAIAWALDPLNDSHTFFIPPPRAYRLDYGWRMQMIGDQCYVTVVKVGTDAEQKGLKPGDLIKSVNKIVPTRESLWKLQYLLDVLRPQPGLLVDLQTPDGSERTLQIKAEIKEEKRLLEPTDFFAEKLKWESGLEMMHRRSYEVNHDVIVWKMPSYSMNEKGVDAMIGQSRDYKTLILDLRGNGGGRVDTLERMVGNFFDHDIEMATIQSRKKLPPARAKNRGDRGFKGKLLVLVDSRSASASEIFARIVQLEKRGLVIGDRTAGAVMESQFHAYSVGLSQRVGYGTTITVANLIMKDGVSLEHVGVTPDQEIIPTAADLRDQQDPVLSRAVQLAGAELSPEAAGKLFPIQWPK
jgi:carboxyl-terminal processing protease